MVKVKGHISQYTVAITGISTKNSVPYLVVMKTKTEALSIPFLSVTTNLFYLTIFALPMINHANQLIVGSAVSLMLFLGAKKLSNKELLPLAILPSLGAIANGVLFGSFTMFLVYFAPTIWLGNYLMMIIYNHLEKSPELMRVTSAAIAKAGLLFLTAFTLVKLSIVPAIFLTAMGLVQLITALVGGVAAMFIGKSKFFTTVKEELKNE